MKQLKFLNEHKKIMFAIFFLFNKQNVFKSAWKHSMQYASHNKAIHSIQTLNTFSILLHKIQ